MAFLPAPLHRIEVHIIHLFVFLFYAPDVEVIKTPLAGGRSIFALGVVKFADGRIIPHRISPHFVMNP